jgi:cation transport regulator
MGGHFVDNLNVPKDIVSILPPPAQSIYRRAYRRAYEEYVSPGREQGYQSMTEMLHKKAWAVVAATYKKKRRSEYPATIVSGES